MIQDFIDAVLEKFNPYEFAGGETLFVEKEPADAWLFVGLGKLKLTEKIPSVLDSHACSIAAMLNILLCRGATKKQDKTVMIKVTSGNFLDAVPFMFESGRKTRCKVDLLAAFSVSFDRFKPTELYFTD